MTRLGSPFWKRDLRLKFALSYLREVLKRYDEMCALYFEGFEIPLDDTVEDARLVLAGTTEAPIQHVGPRARIVRVR